MMLLPEKLNIHIETWILLIKINLKGRILLWMNRERKRHGSQDRAIWERL